MNIADKRRLYAEVHRVLKPGGRFAFQEMAAGEAATSYFPLPWAIDHGDSFLVAVDEMRSVLGESGFIVEHCEETSDAYLGRTPLTTSPRQLTVAVFVDNLAEKARNVRRNLEGRQIRLVRSVFRVK